MNSYERAHSALHFQEADRIPIDFCGTTVTGVAIETLHKIFEHYGVKPSYTIPDHIQQIGVPQGSLNDILGIDTFRVGPRRDPNYETDVITGDGYLEIADGWDVTWRKKEGEHYFSQTTWPLSGDNVSEKLKTYQFPSPDVSELEKSISRTAVEKTERFPILDRDAAGLLEMSGRLRGMEELFIDMYQNKKNVEELAERIFQYKIDYWGTVLDMYGPSECIVSEADDYGTDTSLLISPELISELYLPRIKRLIDFIKRKNEKAKFFFHCCGAIREIIPQLIDIGVDILNPVQYTAAGMDLKELKKDFGKDLVFWGGGIDTKKVLPSGTSQEVRDEVKRVIDIMAADGGFVFTTIHNVQSDVPIENFVAMIETVHEYGRY